MNISKDVYIGLGSNLNDPVEQIKHAMNHLAELPESRLINHSKLYWNKPLENRSQPDYVNAVTWLRSALPARTLLGHLQAIEVKQGRIRTRERWQARSLDLDILLYGEECIKEPGLTVPHPGLLKRVFVVLPLLELNQDLTVPGWGPLIKLRSSFSESELRPVENP